MRYKDYDLARASLALSTFLCLFSYTTQTLAAANPLGPAAISVGPVAFTPAAGVEVKHRDNIYLQEQNETDSWIYIARPTLNTLVQDRENVYQLDYKGEAGWYDVSRHNDDNDYFDNTISGDAHMEFTERWIAEAYMRWAALHEDRGTGLSEGLIGAFIPEPIEYDQGNVGGSLQYGSDDGVGRLLLKGGYMDREYQNFKALTSPRNRDETTAATTFFYPIAPNTDMLAEASYKQINYPNPFETALPLDSDEHALMVGAEWEMTPNLTSIARAGYVNKDFKDQGRKDWDGLGWSVELWLKPRDQDTILVRSVRAPEETTLQGDFIQREDLRAIWTHDWSDQIYTELGALVGRETYEQSTNDREDDIYNVSFKVGYEFRRWANVYAGYSYDDKDSNAENLSYTDNVFTIGVEFSL